MLSLGRDLRYGARLLRNSPRSSVIALITLALGVGAATAIFSVLDAVLLKPLPFRDADRLVVVWEDNRANPSDGVFVAPANFREWQLQNQVFDGMAALQSVHINLTGGPNGYLSPEELAAERVSAEMFPLLGIRPVAGRWFRTDEDQGRVDVAMLSHRLWVRRFGADRSIAGKSIRLRGRSYLVAGVLPAGFSILDPAVDVWIPLGMGPAAPRNADVRFLTVIARLKPGATMERARSEMLTIGARLEQANPALDRGWHPLLIWFRNELVGKVEQAVRILMGAVGLLLLMACVNVANLLLARGASRKREIALRMALGAGRGRIARQLLAESLLLGLAGGTVGLALARGGIALLIRLAPATLPRVSEVKLDGRLFLFALCASLAAGVLSGLAPILSLTGARLSQALAEGGRGRTAGTPARLARNALVVFQVAIAVTVLIGAGLLIRSLAMLRATDPGFSPEGVLSFRLPVGGGRNSAPDRRAAFLDDVERQIRALPGVRSVGAISGLPMTGLGMGMTFADAGRPAPPPEARPIALSRVVTPQYFKAMGVRLLAGRWLNEQDSAGASPVAVVDEQVVRRLWPAASSPSAALDAEVMLDLRQGVRAKIAGVVANVKPERMDQADWPTIYSPYAQAADVASVMTVVTRTAGRPLAIAPAVERIVHSLDPEQPVADLREMEDVVDQSMAGARFHAVVLGVFAQLAFVLAAVGIYGVISYDVTQRTQEIGIRMALGAGKAQVVRLLLRQAAAMAGLGIALGLGLAFGLTRFMSAMLYGVKPVDAGTFATAAALLAAVALAASYLPARRALDLDPLVALKQE